jgi:hypothetical protein
MIDVREAKNIAIEKLKEIQDKSKVELMIMEDLTIEFEYGWMFFYQSTEYIRTKNPGAMIGGNAPIIVDKYNSSVHVTGTRREEQFYIEKYCQYRDSPAIFNEEIRK